MTIEAVSAPTQQLIDVIQTTIDQDGGRWLDSDLGAKLKFMILTRSRDLDTQIDRAVRLAAVLNACDRQGYMNFMYLKVRRISVGNVSAHIVKSFQADLLEGACEIRFKKIRTRTRDNIGVEFESTPDGVDLSVVSGFETTELPELIEFAADGPMSFFGKPYTIGFGQIPLALAVLDFLHNSLGFGGEGGVAPLVDGIRKGAAAGAADDAALALRGAIKAWLDERMAGTYPIRQSLVLRSFLQDFSKAAVEFHRLGTADGASIERISIAIRGEHAGTFDVEDWHRRRWPEAYRGFLGDAAAGRSVGSMRQGVYADLIDDDSILLFWEFAIRSDSIDAGQIGMLRYRSAACALLDYRRALLLSAVENAAATAASLTNAEGGDIGIRDARSTVDAPAERWSGHGVNSEYDGDDEERRTDDTETNRGQIPAGLTAVDGDAGEWDSPLEYFVAGPAKPVKWLAGTNFELLRLAMGGSGHQHALFGGAKPNRMFARTLARHVGIGAIQERLIQGAEWDRVWDGEADPYLDLSAKIKWLRRVTRDLVYATAHALILRDEHALAIVVLRKIEPDLIKQTFAGRPPAMDVGRLARHIAEQLQAGAAEAGRRMLEGSKATARAGFRAVDRDDDVFTDDLRDGSEYVFELFREVDELADWFDGFATGAYARDAARFATTLAMMYGQDRR